MCTGKTVIDGNWTDTGMKVIRHAGVDSRMIILDDQAHDCHMIAVPFNMTSLALLH